MTDYNYALGVIADGLHAIASAIYALGFSVGVWTLVYLFVNSGNTQP